jgi:exosortase
MRSTAGRRLIGAGARAPKVEVTMAAATAAAIVFVYLPVFSHAVDVWRLDQEFSFGFLVPPVALGLVAWRWRELAAARSAGPAASLLALAAGMLLFLAGSRADVHALAAASFLPVVLSAVAYLYGLTAARLSALPVLLLTGALSLYRGLLSSIGFALQQLTAQAAAGAAVVLGVPVHRSGVDLFVGKVHLVVAEACSGMDSLLALLCLGLTFTGLVPAPLVRRAVLIALVLPIILAANVIRVTLVLVLSQPLGRAVAQGLLHELLSAFLFVAATVLFAVAGLALRCAPSLAATRSSSA